jgi:hypothetical protein
MLRCVEMALKKLPLYDFSTVKEAATLILCSIYFTMDIQC